MTHQAPKNVQSPQSRHTVTSQGLTSPQDENSPNADQNDSTVSQADDTSAETEYLENLTEEYERTEKRGSPIFSEKLQKLTQDLIWGIYRTEKFEQVMEENFSPESIEGLEVSKVNTEVWRKILHSTKHSDIRLQNLQNMILKNQSINCFLLESLYKGTKLTDPLELLELVKASLKKCADSAMILGKRDQNLLTLRRDSITPELNIDTNIYLFHKASIPNYYLETISLDQLNKSQKLIKWVSFSLRNIFRVAPVVVMYP